jgi:hypothetical protein
MLRNIYRQRLRPGVVLWYDLSNERGTRFCTWNVRSLNRAGSLMAAARELARYKFDVLGVPELR